MKTYNQTNFFKHTFCEFKQVTNFEIPKETNFKSKSDSFYFYTAKGVYRKSNHWGRVANCRWKINTNEDYKNQQEIIGFAKWSDFYPINSTEKIFFIDVNFDEKIAKLKAKEENTTHYLFSFSEGQSRIKQIHNLFKDDKWTKYFELETNDLYFKVITKFINSDKSFQEIKKGFKSLLSD